MTHPAGKLSFSQELVEYIIDFLHDSPRDWPACALVARSWIYPTQSHIFQSVRLIWPLLRNERLWARFEALTNESPHLIRHKPTPPRTQSSPSALSPSCICKGLPTEGVHEWLTHPRSPFDVSGLRHLISSFTRMELLLSEKFAPALRAIQALVLSADTTKPTLNLSSLPNLAFLRICVIFRTYYPWVFATLSTIAPTQRILKIVLVGQLDTVLSEQVDAQLASLPTPPVLELEPTEYDRMIPHMPPLNAQTLLRMNLGCGILPELPARFDIVVSSAIPLWRCSPEVHS
ncbi:hypothetical protein C8R44DRAFT_857986 [Mycena epipterygia]|nr:hypothetical protein C8R44DRAFT_857986 [Mycena epipterygia]